MSSWSVEVTSAAKIYNPNKHVVYVIQVAQSPTEEPYFVYRRYNDLYDMQVALLKMFPIEAGNAGMPRTIPFMPGKQILLPGQSKLGLAKSRIDAFNDYFYDLMAMDPKISNHVMVRQLLTRTKKDEQVEKEIGNMYGNGGELAAPEVAAARGPSTVEEIERVTKIVGDAPTAEELRTFMSREAIATSTGAAAAAPPAAAPVPAVAKPQPKQPKGKVLFATDGDSDSAWAGSKLKGTLTKRTENQYAAFASPCDAVDAPFTGSKTSQMKLDNVTFGELILTIADDIEVNYRLDLVQNDLEETSTGSDIAEYLVKNIEGMESVDESIQIGEELIKLNVMRPVSCVNFAARPGNFYFFMRNERNRRGPTLEELESHREDLIKCIKLVASRLGGETGPLPPHTHMFRQFNNLNLTIDCEVCKKPLLPVSVACSLCGCNLHIECERYAREFCLYPMELPAVLVEDATYRALAARTGPRTDRFVQRRDRRATPLEPGVINTMAPTRIRETATSASASSPSSGGEPAADVVPPKPVFTRPAEARPAVVASVAGTSSAVRTLPITFLTSAVDDIPKMTPVEWQDFLKGKSNDAEAAGQDVLAETILRISQTSRVPSIVPWNELKSSCASAFGLAAPVSAQARPAAATPGAVPARPTAVAAPSPTPNAPLPATSTLARSQPVPAKIDTRAASSGSGGVPKASFAPRPTVPATAAAVSITAEGGDDADAGGNDDEYEDEDDDMFMYDPLDDESTTSLAMMLVSALGSDADSESPASATPPLRSASVSGASGSGSGSAQAPTPYARRSSKLFSQKSSKSMAGRELPSPSSAVGTARPSASTPVPSPPTTRANATTTPAPRPTPPTPTAGTPRLGSTPPTPTTSTAPRATATPLAATGPATAPRPVPPVPRAASASSLLQASSSSSSSSLSFAARPTPPTPTPAAAASTPTAAPPAAPRPTATATASLSSTVSLPPRPTASTPPTPTATFAGARPPAPTLPTRSASLSVPARPSATASSPVPSAASRPTAAATPAPQPIAGPTPTPAPAAAAASAPAAAAAPPPLPGTSRPSLTPPSLAAMPPRPTATTAATPAPTSSSTPTPSVTLPPRPTAAAVVPTLSAAPSAKAALPTAPRPSTTSLASSSGPRPTATAVPAAATQRPGQRKLRADFAADRASLLGAGDVAVPVRDAWYNRLVDEAEDAGQLGLTQAIFVLRKKPVRGAAELAEWDLIMQKYAATSIE